MRPVLTLALGLAALSHTAKAEPINFALDPAHTSVAMFVSHLGYYDQAATFRDVTGSFTYDPETQELSDLRVTIPTETFYSGHQARDNHMKSSDFLNVREFPEITFVMTEAERLGENSGRIAGELTMIGATNPVELDVTLNQYSAYPFGPYEGTDVLGVSATTTIMRTEWGMDYFAPAVGDEIEIRIGFEAPPAEVLSN